MLKKRSNLSFLFLFSFPKLKRRLQMHGEWRLSNFDRSGFSRTIFDSIKCFIFLFFICCQPLSMCWTLNDAESSKVHWKYWLMHSLKWNYMRTHHFQIIKYVNTLVHSCLMASCLMLPNISEQKIYKKSISIFERHFLRKFINYSTPLRGKRDVACDERHVPLWFSMWKFMCNWKLIIFHNDYYSKISVKIQMAMSHFKWQSFK